MVMGTYPAFRMASGFGAGAAAGAHDITITGITAKDEIIFALHMIATDAIITDDLTAEMTITAADTVRCSTTDTTGGVVWVFWVVK